ncbi:ammonium transporter [Cerasicoccus frondis]|uniref:ammonium transporter n=1 Tax=Cerasicoccus frondis TaxID=490090 RepID=UPI0028524EEB|nr:ammonium transporter [Cerasicoccus frondis]
MTTILTLLKMKRWTCLFGILAFSLFTLTAQAQDILPDDTAAMAEAVEAAAEEAPAMLSQTTGDILWLIIAAVLVFFMQAGFAMVESGLTRAKNACNIMMKNMLDFSFGAIAFLAVGYSLMYGAGDGFIGWSPEYFFMEAAIVSPENASAASVEAAGWVFQVVFAATAATIASGAMAERTKFVGYVMYSIMISAILYPITGHWIWSGDGWLGGMGMRDFAGSTVVHSVGAWAGLAGAMILGARKGKYSEDGKPLPIPGHNLPMATLGGFILFFGWFGFNAGSTLAAVDGLAYVSMTTLLAAAAGTCGATVATWAKFGKPDLSMAINGCLAGLVSITAPCASVSPISAVIIGAIGGVIVVFSVLFVERTLKIDDPVGAVSVHGVCGAWGTLSIGFFGSSAIDTVFWDAETCIKDGLFYGGGVSQLGIQLLGVAAVFAFTFICSYGMFFAIDKMVGLRVSAEEELEGLDLGEHGNEAYADFQQYADEPL